MLKHKHAENHNCDVPPTSPLLLTTSATSSSVQLQWKQGDNGGAVIKGFLLSYRVEHGKWEEISVDRRMSTYLLDGLHCGMRYEFRLSAYNKIGVGTQSNVESTRTKGGKPIPSVAEKILEVNATSVRLNLASWSDGGCPLSHFFVEYKNTGGIWILASNNVMPRLKFSIVELRPSTKYTVKITGHNSAGRTSAEYNIFTLPGLESGEHVIHETPDQEVKNDIPFYLHAQIIVTCVFSFLLVMIVVGTLCICFQKRETFLRRTRSEEPQTSTALVDKYTEHRERDQYYATVRKPLQSPCRDVAALERIPEYSEDIYPYATFHLPELNSVGTSANPLRRHVYAYSNSSADSVPVSKVDPEKYPKTHRGRKTKTAKSESEEYDSDSETEAATSSHTESSNQLDAGMRLRTPHDNLLCHRHGSNTLAGLSPTCECKTKRYRHGEKLGWLQKKLRSDCPKHMHENWGQRNEADCCIDPIGTLHAHRNKNLLNIFNPNTSSQQDFTIAV